MMWLQEPIRKYVKVSAIFGLKLYNLTIFSLLATLENKVAQPQGTNRIKYVMNFIALTFIQ
jgi:hypothetical protein